MTLGLIVEVFLAIKVVIAFITIMSPIDLAMALLVLLCYVAYNNQ